MSRAPVSASVPSTGTKPTIEVKPTGSTTTGSTNNPSSTPASGPNVSNAGGANAAPKPGQPAPVAATAAKPAAPGPATSAVSGKPAPAAVPVVAKPTVSKEKLQAVSLAVAQIEKTFGKGSVMKLDERAFLSIPGISTGTLSLDLACGGRGIPRGRIIEIFGPESSGKTTLALTIAANAQRDGGVAAVIDAEHALDPSWARKIGVNIDELLVSQPDTGEQGLEICELLVRSNAVDLIVVDSVAALIPRAEIEGDMGDATMGMQARLMSQAMRKLTGVIARSNCVVIFINQIREKIGVMFGSPETTTGGRALKFYASLRIDVRRTGAIKDGDVTIGSRTRARVVKNKVAPPFRDAEFDIMYDEGISTSGDLLDLAVDAGVVDKSGAWFNYGDIRLGQGRENSKKFIKENIEVFAEIRRKTLAVKLAGSTTIKASLASDGDTSEE